MTGISRRGFIGSAAAATAGAVISPHGVLAEQAAANRAGAPGNAAAGGSAGPGAGPGADEKLAIGIIGCAGRGRDNLRGVADENIVALCDVDSANMREAARAHPDARHYTDFRQMLEREGDALDAVVISTPDHTHAVAAAMAMKMGKHVYCEKPLARSIGEVRALKALAASTGVVTQMGNQAHASDGIREFRELIEAGAIGTVREIHYATNRPIWPQGLNRPLEAFNPPPTLDWDLWQGPVRERPYAPAYAPFRWRGWWDYGTGALGDIAVHAMDAAFWTLDLGFPTRIQPETTRLFDETAPVMSRLTFDFPKRDGRAPVRMVWRDGNFQTPRPKGLPGGESWPYGNVGSQLWIGDEGAILADVYCDGILLMDPEQQRHWSENPPAERYPRTDGVYAEWIAGAKGGPKPGSSFDSYAGPFTEAILLGNLAVRMQETLEVDAESGEVTNVEVPSEYIMPEFREGWVL